MLTKDINRLENQIEDLNSNAEAIELVESRLDTDQVAEYLEDNQYMDREALLYCLQDEIQDEIDHFDKYSGSEEDIQSFARKTQAIDTETALIYDVSLGYLKAVPMTKAEIIDMVDNLTDD